MEGSHPNTFQGYHISNKRLLHSSCCVQTSCPFSKYVDWRLIRRKFQPRKRCLRIITSSADIKENLGNLVIVNAQRFAGKSPASLHQLVYRDETIRVENVSIFCYFWHAYSRRISLLPGRHMDQHRRSISREREWTGEETNICYGHTLQKTGGSG